MSDETTSTHTHSHPEERKKESKKKWNAQRERQRAKTDDDDYDLRRFTREYYKIPNAHAHKIHRTLLHGTSMASIQFPNVCKRDAKIENTYERKEASRALGCLQSHGKERWKKKQQICAVILRVCRMNEFGVVRKRRTTQSILHLVESLALPVFCMRGGRVPATIECCARLQMRKVNDIYMSRWSMPIYIRRMKLHRASDRAHAEIAKFRRDRRFRLTHGRCPLSDWHTVHCLDSFRS